MEAMRATPRREPWNKGKLVGQKAPLKLKDIWAIRVRLQMHERLRELALLNLGIDSKLRAGDLVRLRVRDICHGDRVAARAMVLQQKTQRPVQFEITPPAREVLQSWIKRAGLKSENFLFPSRVGKSSHLGTRQYARIVDNWLEEIGLDPARLWHAFHPTNEGIADLPPDQKPSSRSTSARTHQAREHGPLPWDRGRRRARNRRTDRSLKPPRGPGRFECLLIDGREPATTGSCEARRKADRQRCFRPVPAFLFVCIRTFANIVHRPNADSRDAH